ncbi:uncharacterized protein LOC133524047 [Cydia pomonella]|uniref:uncharacterized protein LOC133524047 n=1 Tax=Cydia pomonella TaxID=82600 RepID=UPI002ADDFB5F|nr:uncharacterized protein LOC133524047 [Cydia pomonella]
MTSQTKTEVIVSTTENPEGVCMLFDICKEVKLYYESPVIFLTKTDFSDKAFNVMCTVHTILNEERDEKTKGRILDLIVDYQLQWLQYVNAIENFEQLVIDRTLPKEELYQAVNYTMDSMTYRLKHFQRLIEKNRSGLSNENHAILNAELEIVEEMHKEIAKALVDKLKCFRGIQSGPEFDIKLKSEVEDLLQWLDKISDNLAILLSKYVSFNVQHLSSDLTKTLQQIVEEFKTDESPSAKKMLEELKEKGKDLCSMVRSTASHDLEINKVVEKIAVLDDRIKRLEEENAHAALGALRYKKDFLEARLNSLDNLKTTLKSLHNLADYMPDVPLEELCECPDFFQMRIFNHALPSPERERLISEFCYLWDIAVNGKKKKSIISILSATEEKEEFTDELGIFYIDEYGRKIYKKPDEPTLYQCNESEILVPLSDDSEHVYFYDECGRHFLDPQTRQKIYKAHATASEFMMDSSGALIKLKEIRNGITYYYDNFGRYYINEENKRIYIEEDSTSEYENDGFGNLVRIRSQLDILEPCPDDENVTEDFNYLKRNVGVALRECIAKTIVAQPADPVKYLSTCLFKYRDNIEQREKRAREKEQLDVEREIRAAEEREALEKAAREAALLMAQGGSEASYDSNLVNYQHSPDILSTSSKQ